MKSLKITNQITKRESDSFIKYLHEVNKLSKNNNLTSDEEIELAKRIKQGDVKAEKELIERNLRFVISVAKQHQNQGCELEDLVNEGNIGLIKAARKYETTRGCKFISYAVWLIRQSILCYLSDNSRTIRLPLNKIGQLNKIKKAQDKFEQIHQRRPSTDEVIEMLDFEMSAEEIDKLFVLDNGIQSINTQLSNNSNNSKSEVFTLEDLLIDYSINSTDECMDKEDLQNTIKRILNKIHINQRIVIEMYYGLNGYEPKTIDEIAEYLDLSRERIRQIKNNTMRILNNEKNYIIIRPYLK